MRFPVELSFASANGEAVNKSRKLGLKFPRSHFHQKPADRRLDLLKPHFQRKIGA
jgi:hypothetical protein